MIDEEAPPLSSKARYVRGFAAHYASEPDDAQTYLTAVTTDPQPGGEPAATYQRRVANAYYYLGVTKSNFGDIDEAVAHFSEAYKLDTDRRDFLTRLVAAEALAMGGRSDPILPEAAPNESSDVIHTHIQSIRDGLVLQPGRFASAPVGVGLAAAVGCRPCAIRYERGRVRSGGSRSRWSWRRWPGWPRRCCCRRSPATPMST